jgi:hypothetical protein
MPSDGPHRGETRNGVLVCVSYFSQKRHASVGQHTTAHSRQIGPGERASASPTSVQPHSYKVRAAKTVQQPILATTSLRPPTPRPGRCAPSRAPAPCPQSGLAISQISARPCAIAPLHLGARVDTAPGSPYGLGSATTAANQIRQHQPPQQPTRGGANSSVHGGATASDHADAGSGCPP